MERGEHVRRPRRGAGRCPGRPGWRAGRTGRASSAAAAGPTTPTGPPASGPVASAPWPPPGGPGEAADVVGDVPAVYATIDDRPGADVPGDEQQSQADADDQWPRPAAPGHRQQPERRHQDGGDDGDADHPDLGRRAQVGQQPEHHRPHGAGSPQVVVAPQPQHDPRHDGGADDEDQVAPQPGPPLQDQRRHAGEHRGRHRDVVVPAVDELVRTPPIGHEHDRQPDQQPRRRQHDPGRVGRTPRQRPIEPTGGRDRRRTAAAGHPGEGQDPETGQPSVATSWYQT